MSLFLPLTSVLICLFIIIYMCKISLNSSSIKRGHGSARLTMTLNLTMTISFVLYSPKHRHQVYQDNHANHGSDYSFTTLLLTFIPVSSSQTSTI